MSDTQLLNGGTYTAINEYDGTGTSSVPDYRTLGNYYIKQCPFQTKPGETAGVKCVTLTPVFGGVGYKILQNNLPASQLSDTGYFNLTNAYPYYPDCNCMKPFNQ